MFTNYMEESGNYQLHKCEGMAEAPKTKAPATKAPATKAPDDRSPRRQKPQSIAIFL